MKKATRILVVDDDPCVLELFSEYLRRQDYEVFGASTGRQALQKTRELRPDVVVSDVRLPDIDGTAVCRQIKTDATLQDVFVVLISGGAITPADKVDGLDIGADDYLVKPVDFDEFLARIRTIVRLRDTTAALRASEHHYRQLIEILPDAVGLVELNGNFLVVNPQATAMLGYHSPTELLEHNLFDLVHARDHDRLTADLVMLRQTGIMPNTEYTMLKKSGSEFPVEMSAALSKDPSGEPLSLVVVMRDITARKRTEEDLRYLSRRINEAQEAERLRVARELHDGVNQLIASAKMRLHKVGNMSGALTPVAREILARCEKQLVQALEENRRIAHNLRPSDLDEFGLAEACHNFCKELQTRTNLSVKSSITLQGKRLPPEAELNLFRIVQEAINNTEKHAKANAIRLRMTYQDEAILLKIQDEGRGIDPSALPIDHRKGHGIGLSSLRERVASLGGTCLVESQINEGTTITVRVPVRAQ